MGILPGLLWAFLNLLCVGIDIAIFFVAIRLVLMWRNTSWLVRLNSVGKELVAAILSETNRLWYRVAQKKLSVKGELLVSIVGLSVARFLLCEIVRLFSM